MAASARELAARMMSEIWFLQKCRSESNFENRDVVERAQRRRLASDPSR
jgi:hypothetical protein